MLDFGVTIFFMLVGELQMQLDFLHVVNSF
jgi:hypothetical protein